MTLGDHPGSSLERFAAEWLGSGGDDGHSALLRRLRDEDFLPEPVDHDAIRVLCGRPLGGGSWLAEEAERRLRDEVERFAADYFATPPVERRARWRALAVSCASHAGLDDRLRHLARGLDVDLGAFKDDPELVGRLVGHCSALFLLCPRPRAVACRELVRDLRGDESVRDAELSRALKQLRKRHGPVAALAPEFLTRLAGPRRPKRLRRLPPGFVPSSAPETDSRRLTFNRIMFILSAIVVCLRATLPSPRLSSDLDAVPPSSPPLPGIVLNPNPSARFRRAFRDQFKDPIRSTLKTLHKAIDEPDLQRVVDALPVEDVPEVGGMATLVLLGYWTEDVHARHAAALRKELARAGIVLDDAEFEKVVRKTFPSPTKPSGGEPWPSGGILRPPGPGHP